MMIEIKDGVIYTAFSLPSVLALWRAYRGLKKYFDTQIEEKVTTALNTVLSQKSDKAHEGVCHSKWEQADRRLARGDDEFKSLQADIRNLIDRISNQNGKISVLTDLKGVRT